MAILFVSDLHLCSSRPEANRILFEFLAGPARAAESLYILGDLFEYWAGDDDIDDPLNAAVVAALRECARRTPICAMRGNRDFLLGAGFASAAGVRLIEDPQIVELHGTRTLLLHGDTLCTDDVDYQRFRAEVRTADWMESFLATPLAARKARIEELRGQSEIEKRRKPQRLMDVNEDAVMQRFRSSGCTRIVHDHTHRPARHEYLVGGRHCERWVLADWYSAGSYLRCDASGLTQVSLRQS